MLLGCLLKARVCRSRAEILWFSTVVQFLLHRAGLPVVSMGLIYIYIYIDISIHIIYGTCIYNSIC